jgi:hypothetical protein
MLTVRVGAVRTRASGTRLERRMRICAEISTPSYGSSCNRHHVGIVLVLGIPDLLCASWSLLVCLPSGEGPACA